MTTSLKIGGAETVLVDLIRNMDADLFENVVIYFHEGPNLEKLENLNVKIYKINGFFCKYDPIFIFRLFLLIKKLNPDCIHSLLWSANILGNLLASLLKIPIVSAIHLATNFESTGKNNYFRTFLDRIFLAKSNAIVVVSQSLISELKRDNKWLPFEKIKMIRNGIDIENIKKEVSLSNFNQQDFQIPDNTFIVGTVGRFIPRKNQKMLISSFAKLAQDYKNIHLILIGYGSLEDILRINAKELGISNKVSFIKSNHANQFYQFFDCFVLSSTNESFGLVTLEAMLFGLPCIVSTPDMRNEIIQDGINGYLIKNDDINDLYLKMKILYEDKERRIELGLKAKQTVYENFDIKIMVNNYEKLFKEFSKVSSFN